MLLPPTCVRAYQVGDSQRYHAIVRVCVKGAYDCVCTSCERVTSEVDATVCFIPQARNGSFETMCPLQLLFPRADRWHGTNVIYVKAITNRTGKEDVILIEKCED